MKVFQMISFFNSSYQSLFFVVMSVGEWSVQRTVLRWNIRRGTVHILTHIHTCIYIYVNIYIINVYLLRTTHTIETSTAITMTPIMIYWRNIVSEKKERSTHSLLYTTTKKPVLTFWRSRFPQVIIWTYTCS